MANGNQNNPFDLTQWFSQFSSAGLDVQSMMESSRKDWEAVQQANQTAMEGWQKLAQKQNELMQQAAQQWQSNLMASLSRTPQENADKLREDVESGMATLRELAEIVTESQTEAGNILRQRFEENLARLNPQASPAKKSPAAKSKRTPRKR